MNRTQAEIVERAREQSKQMFAFAISDLLEWLDYDNAQEFIKKDVTFEQWAGVVAARKPVVSQMREYLPFAWEKANNFRGLSAARSMEHYSNWLWLIGEDELARKMEVYDCYGKDNLVAVCNFLGVDSSQWDDGVRANSENDAA